MNIIKRILIGSIALFASYLASTASVYASEDKPVAPVQLAQASVVATSNDVVEGEVKKVDKEMKKITLKHSEIKNLDMPGMTMVFRVKDSAMLDQVKAGDKVRFKAEKMDGAITVTEITPGK